MSQKRNEKIRTEIRKHITVNGNVINTEQDMYLKLCPKGVTRETIEQVQNFRNEIVAPYVDVVADKALEIMKSDPDVDVLSTSTNFGNEEITISISRKANVIGDEGEPAVEYGNVIVSNKFDMGEHQIEYDKVVSTINDVFAKQFSATDES